MRLLPECVLRNLRRSVVDRERGPEGWRGRAGALAAGQAARRSAARWCREPARWSGPGVTTTRYVAPVLRARIVMRYSERVAAPGGRSCTRRSVTKRPRLRRCSEARAPLCSGATAPLKRTRRPLSRSRVDRHADRRADGAGDARHRRDRLRDDAQPRAEQQRRDREAVGAVARGVAAGDRVERAGEREDLALEHERHGAHAGARRVAGDDGGALVRDAV